MNTPANHQQPQKDQAGNDLHTEEPLSEKDEVKQAEEKTGHNTTAVPEHDSSGNQKDTKDTDSK